MTSEEAIVELRSHDTEGDPEIAHSDADEVLLEVLRSNGFGEVADAYEQTRRRIGFWYA